MIFYFSGTGNTRWAATHLAKALGEQLLFIPDELNGPCRYTLSEGERLGFCFPVHGWMPPRIVLQFISWMQLSHTPHHCYALITCGDSTGHTIPVLAKALIQKGIHLHASYALVMPESYVCLPFMKTDTPEREKEKKEKAAKLIVEHEQHIIRKDHGHHDAPHGPLPWLLTHVIGQWFTHHLITDRHFTTNSKCISCGICQKECPTKNITLHKGTPQWAHQDLCTACLSCYHHCPRHAINYGPLTKKRGQYYFNK